MLCYWKLLLKVFQNNPFPPVETATEDGVVAIGGSCTYQLLVSAYLQGIFPWPSSESDPLLWFSPDPRAIIRPKNLKLGKSFIKEERKKNLEIRVNENFEEVITTAAEYHKRKNQGTWITKDIVEGYLELFSYKKAYSISVYENQNMIGGIYGVNFGKFLSAESMFSLKPNGAKFALKFLCETSAKQNIEWIDIQVINPFTESLGAEEISRLSFVSTLRSLISSPSVKWNLHS